MIRVGGWVRLKSGGETMTVDRLFVDENGDQRAEVNWFEGGNLRTKSFSLEGLVPIKDDDLPDIPEDNG